MGAQFLRIIPATLQNIVKLRIIFYLGAVNIVTISFEKYAKINGGANILMVGFGSIGPAVLPLIIRHLDIDKKQISIIAAENTNQKIAEQYGVNFECVTLTKDNYKDILNTRLRPGDFLLNLSVNISSLDLILFCHELNISYLDTSLERWLSEKDIDECLHERRTKLMTYKEYLKSGATALICNGANPGLISHIAKQAILDVAEKVNNEPPQIPATQEEWAKLVKDLNIVTLHIAERDTQFSSQMRQSDEYVNTWSVAGLLDESLEHTGFSWGTHEYELPGQIVKKIEKTDNYRFIQLTKYGADTKVKSWIDEQGIFHGFVIPHAESFSLAEYFCYRDKQTNQISHPTIHYAYQPCNDAIVSLHDAVENNQTNPDKTRILHSDIVDGYDELGVLIFRQNSPEIYWLGSKLSIQEARTLVNNNTATSLQVAIGILVGIIHVINNPRQGLIEPEQCDFVQALKIASPYLGKFSGQWGVWPEESDYSWRFADLSVNLI